MADELSAEQKAEADELFAQLEKEGDAVKAQYVSSHVPMKFQAYYLELNPPPADPAPPPTA